MPKPAIEGTPTRSGHRLDDGRLNAIVAAAADGNAGRAGLCFVRALEAVAPRVGHDGYDITAWPVTAIVAARDAMLLRRMVEGEPGAWGRRRQPLLVSAGA
jgi:hypothetical protein